MTEPGTMHTSGTPDLLAVGERAAAAAGVQLSPPANGPFGPEVLVVERGVDGPHLLLVEPRAVPSPR